MLLTTVYNVGLWTVSNCCLSLYLNIAGLRQGPGNASGVLESPGKVLEFFCNRESGNSEMHCYRGGTVVNGVRSLQYTCHGRVLSAQPRDIFVIRCPGRRKFRAHNLAAVGAL